jgi:cobalt-zinc-cadmium efflux system outer membrane protein
VRWFVPILLLALSGCADLPPLEPLPRPVEAGAASPLDRTPTGVGHDPLPESGPLALDMSTMLDLLEKSPTLRAEREKVEVETGSVIQASYMPNPSLKVEAEMIPFDDPSFDGSRNMVRVAQRIETAGKADARVALADAKRYTAEAMYFHERGKLMAAAASEFHAIRLTQDKIAVASNTAALTADLLKLATDLNEKGRLADQALIDARIAVAQADLAVLDLEAQLTRRLAALESLLGARPGLIKTCRGDGEDRFPQPDEAAREAILERNTELVLLDRQLTQARLDIHLQESMAWPDVTAGAAYARATELGGERDDFFKLFVEMPLPLVDRNQGRIMRAQAAERQAQAALEAAATRALNQWDGLARRHAALQKTRELYDQRLIPELKKGVAIARKAFESGRVTRQVSIQAALKLEQANLAVLDIHQQLSDIQSEMILLIGERQR